MSKVKKIFLVSSGPSTVTRVPAALAFMAGICEHHNVEYEVFDLNLDFYRSYGSELHKKINAAIMLDRHNTTERYGKTHDSDMLEYKKLIESRSLEVCKKIKAGNFDALAMTVLSYAQSFWTGSFLTILKQELPHINVIVGGPGVKSSNTIGFSRASHGRYLLENNLADAVVMGEGDILFGKFLLGTAEGEPGFNTKGGEDTWQPQIDDLDATPLPSYKKIRFSDYVLKDNKPEVTITSSKGCVRDCTFCDVGHLWKKFRYRSGPRVAEEMYKSYREMGVTKFWFNDSLVNGSFKQFFEFMESLKKLQANDPGFAQIRWGGQLILRPKNTHTEKMYELLGQTGGRYFQVGIESGSEAVRHHMRKKFSNEDIYYHYEMSEKFKIQNWIFIIVGYPTETDKDFQDTLDLYTNLQKYLINDTIAGSSCSDPTLILENSPLHSMMEELNVHYLFDKSQPSQWSSNDPDGVTPQVKFLRYIQLNKHMLNLGYPTSADIEAKILSVKTHIMSEKHDLKETKIKKTIPITQLESKILS